MHVSNAGVAASILILRIVVVVVIEVLLLLQSSIRAALVQEQYTVYNKLIR
jgi:hypothetical protein